MKLLFTILAAAAPFASCASTQLRGTSNKQALFLSSGGDFSLGVNATFVLDTGKDLTAEEKTFAKYCIRRAYNTVHDLNAMVMKFADIANVDKAPVPQVVHHPSTPITSSLSSTSVDRSRYQPFNWAWGFMTLGNCRLCRSLRDSTTASIDALQLEKSRMSWEQALCAKLRRGPFDTFHSASNCSIGIYLPETNTNHDVVEEVDMGVTSHFTIPSNRDLSTNEQLFANECLRLSYNEVHDPSVEFMETTDLKNQTYLYAGSMKLAGDLPTPETKKPLTSDAVKSSSGSFSWTLNWGTQASFRRINAHDDDNNSGNAFLPALMASSAAVHDQQHNQWQAAFCGKLQTGPFEVFQSIENCRIVVNDITPRFVVGSTSA